MTISRRLGIAGIAVAVSLAALPLAGCAVTHPATASVQSNAPSAASTPTPTPTSAALPGCADFVPPTAFGRALGADVATPPTLYPVGVLAAAGGIGCELQFGEQGSYTGAELMYQVAPASIATPAELNGSQAEAGTPSCQTDPDIMRSNSGCEAVIVDDDWWIETHLFVNSSVQTQTAAVQPVLDLIRAALRGRTTPTVAALSAPTCGRFTSAIAADPAYAGATVSTSPPDDSAGDTRAGWPAVAAARIAPTAACQIDEKDGTGLVVDVVRSPAVATACAATTGATAWTVTTDLTIASTPYVSGGALLCATDGVGSISTYGPFTDDDPSGPQWDAASVAAIAPILKELLAAAR